MDTPTLFESLFSGIIQGITELLPISSSGHLLLFSQIFGTETSLFDVAALHLGTLVAIIVVMRDSIPTACSRKSLTNILISILPAGIIGLFFAETIENKLGSPTTILGSLIFWGIVLILSDISSKKKAAAVSTISKVTTAQALTIGLAQVLAFIPGTSRSGITIIAGIFSGLSAETALAFSFLSGIPLLALSGAYGLFNVVLDGSTDLLSLGIATITAMIVGIGAALLLKKRISKGILTQAGVYRILLGIALFFLFL